MDILTIKELGDHRPDQCNNPCRLENFEIIWITRGDACLMVDKQACMLDNERVCLLAPGRVRQLAIKGAAEGYLISFSSGLEDTLDELCWLDACIDEFSLFVFRGQQEDMEDMEDLLLKMKKEFEKEQQMRKDVLNGLFKVFMLYFSRNYCHDIQKTGSGRSRCMTRKYLSLVKKHFRTKKAVSDYAGELAVSPNYLNQIVKRVSGFSARYHIQQSIVRHAKRQALYSNLSMKEIAGSLGFSDCAHFSKFFKNASGINFSSFKNSV